jgi:hypothetical protein
MRIGSPHIQNSLPAGVAQSRESNESKKPLPQFEHCALHREDAADSRRHCSDHGANSDHGAKSRFKRSFRRSNFLIPAGSSHLRVLRVAEGPGRISTVRGNPALAMSRSGVGSDAFT